MLKTVYKALLLLLGFAVQLSYGQPSLSEIRPEPAVIATLQLFDTYSVVGIGEVHGLQELGDFYTDLVSQPDFAKDVGNIVFEFGNAFFQPVIDRYLAGEEVPYAEVKKAWTTMVGTMGSADIPVMYGQFYKAVREANLTLTKGQKIRVWLGDPPTDPDDPLAYSVERFPDRDAFFADIVMRRILAKGEKALLIIGAGHFVADDYSKDNATVEELNYRSLGEYNVKAFVDAYYPSKLSLIQNYWGLPEPCNQRLEARFESEPTPSLTLLRGTALETFLDSPECRSATQWEAFTSAWSDAYLYLGKSEKLTASPLPGKPEMLHLKTLPKDALEAEEQNE